jgi:hypothetical protein
VLYTTATAHHVLLHEGSTKHRYLAGLHVRVVVAAVVPEVLLVHAHNVGADAVHEVLKNGDATRWRAG